ncbi:MAG: hypothetical protein QNJ11_08965 [Woeseiaceae bacterium]|nr:hypothetical protein [Woeseiaceae bacterium]
MHFRHLKRWSQIVILCCSAPAFGSPLFESHEPLQVELRGPLRTTVEDVDAREERSFTLAVQGTTSEVAVRVRGNNRVDVCGFPPLRLNFRTKEMDGTVFEGQDKLKLVTHCKGASGYENNVLDEYLAYRIFALLTPVSYRVRPLHITYVDSYDSATMTRFGFVIESESDVAARLEGEPFEVPSVRKSQLDSAHSALVFVFHYLIANRDWSLGRTENKESCCHNGSLVNLDGRIHVLPYDFDRSGLVNARYANAGENTRPVRTRVYRGYCMRDLDLDAAIAAIVVREQDILRLVDALPGSSQKDTNSRRRFLAKFFESARAGGLGRDLESDCVG